MLFDMELSQPTNEMRKGFSIMGVAFHGVDVVAMMLRKVLEVCTMT
jgi:hypothetical protein